MPYWTTYKRSLLEPEAPGEWEAVEEKEAAAVFEKLPKLQRAAMPKIEGAPRRVLKIATPFYRDHFLYEFVYPGTIPPLPYYVLAGPGDARLLDWSNGPILAAGREWGCQLDKDTVPDYIRFYFAHVAGRHGRFRLLETADVPVLTDLTDEQAGQLRDRALPLAPGDVEWNGTEFRLPVVMLHKGALVGTTVRVSKGGEVGLDEEEVLVSGLPIAEDQVTHATLPGRLRFDLRNGWKPLAELEDRLQKRLYEGALPSSIDKEVLSYQPLSFFEDAVLLRGARECARYGMGLYALWSPAGMFPLDGSSTPIYEAIDHEAFRLDDETAMDYLRFFSSFVHGEEGPFRIISGIEDLNAEREGLGVGRVDPEQYSECPVVYDWLERDELERLIRPPVLYGGSEDGTWRMSALCQYGGNLCRVTFGLGQDGQRVMIDDEVIVTDIPCDPRLNRIAKDSLVGWEVCLGKGDEIDRTKFSGDSKYRIWYELVKGHLPHFMLKASDGKGDWRLVEVMQYPLPFYRVNGDKGANDRKGAGTGQYSMHLYRLKWEKNGNDGEHAGDSAIVGYFVAGDYGVFIIDFDKSTIDRISRDVVERTGKKPDAICKACWEVFETALRRKDQESSRSDIHRAFSRGE